MRLLLLILLTVLSTASAEGIVVIDSERIFESLGDVSDATELLLAEIEVWETHADSLQEEIDDIRADLDYTMVMSPDRRRERETLLDSKMEALQIFLEVTFGPGGLVESRNEQLVSPIVAAINEAVLEISQEEGYDLVLDAAGGLVVYASSSLDITDIVLEELTSRSTD